MKTKWYFIFFILLIISLGTFVLSIWDVFSQANIAGAVLLIYLILFGMVFTVILLARRHDIKTEEYIKAFTKTLHGGLYHFKCPNCKGVFAIKESLYKTMKQTILTCPDCGHLGMIHSHMAKTISTIPKQKSKNALFKCLYCGESLQIWAEGADLHPQLKVYSCPFCGQDKPLKQY